MTARRWSRNGWVGGEVALTVDNGFVVADADATGQLEISSMKLMLAPIDISPDAVGVPARLEHLQLDLEKVPAGAPTKWTDGDNAATASTMLSLQLSWAVTIDGTTSALGPQHLPPIPVDITVAGDRSTVDLTLTLDLPGTVWGWADLIDIRDLRLVVDTASL